jgi:hypothetical protein
MNTIISAPREQREVRVGLRHRFVLDEAEFARLGEALKRAEGGSPSTERSAGTVVSEIRARAIGLRVVAMFDADEIDSVLCAVEEAAAGAIEGGYSAASLRHLTGAVEFLCRCLAVFQP